MSCRKSKRVAKRQEDEIFWLMHNFPHGIDYQELCSVDPLDSKSSPPSLKTKKLITSVNEKLRDECSSKVVIKMPKVLRSGRTITDIGHNSAELDSDSSSTRTEPKADNSCDSVADAEHVIKTEHDDISEAGEKSTDTNNDTVVTTRRTRSGHSWNLKTDDPQNIQIRNTHSTSKSKVSNAVAKLAAVENDLTPQERQQIAKIERSKLPKFKFAPNKIITRSGAQYPFTWKNCDVKVEAVEHKEKSPEVLPTHYTRSSQRSKIRNNNKKTYFAEMVQLSNEDLALSAMPSIKIKDEPIDPEPDDVTINVKKIKISVNSKVDIQFPSFMFSDNNDDFAALPPCPPQSLNLVRKGKRKRLSLLPAQKLEREDEFTATWLDALNRNQDSSRSPSDQSPSCSRSESPISPISSVSSEASIPQKRTGRTASLNCRAVLSALMRPEPIFKKHSPKSQHSPKSKTLIKVAKLENQPDSFVKIKVNTSYSQRVEFHDNGFATKVYSLPGPLKSHEAAIISQCTVSRISTNGWQWCGSYIDCCSFATETTTRSTRLYFSAMKRHGTELRVGDSVALQTSASDNKPFVGKIISMWQDDLGEMMVTMCWFYRPSDLENIKTPYGSQELYLSKHTDDNSVATIQDKVFVLSYPEYCRYYSHLAEEKRPSRRSRVVPNVVKWRKDIFQNAKTQNDNIYFCRGVYDFRLRRTLKQQLYYTKFL